MIEIRLNKEEDGIRLMLFVNFALIMNKKENEDFVSKFLGYFNIRKIEMKKDNDLDLNLDSRNDVCVECERGEK